MCIYICELFWHRGLKAFCTGCTEGIAVNPFCEPVFPICRLRSFVFSLVAAAFWIPASTHGSRRKKQCCAKYTNLKSDFWRDFLAYCTRPVSVHLAMACVGCSFNNFSSFLLSLKQQQNLMKIMFSCIHFPIWPYPPKIMQKNVFYTSKLYGLTDMQSL